MARILLSAAALAVLAGCATPALTYRAVPEHGNTDGSFVMALPEARIVITPPEPDPETNSVAELMERRANANGADDGGGDDDEEPAEEEEASAPGAVGFELRYEANADATYLVEPRNNWWAETQIAPTYRPDTTVVASLGVQTIDRRAQLAEDIAGVINLFGDATFLNEADPANPPAPDATCYVIEADWIRDQLEPLSAAYIAARNADGRAQARRTTLSTIRQPAPDSTSYPCRMHMRFSELPTDAVSLAWFNANRLGHSSDFMIGAACRRLEIAYGYMDGERQVWTRREFSVPDPFFIRLSPLPLKGKLDAANVCAPPSHEPGEANLPSPVGVIRAIAAPFRNDAATAPAASGDDSGGGEAEDEASGG